MGNAFSVDAVIHTWEQIFGYFSIHMW